MAECTNYEEVEKSIDTVSTWKCSKYMSEINKTESNGNSTTKYQCIAGDLVNFIPSNEITDIY